MMVGPGGAVPAMFWAAQQAQQAISAPGLPDRAACECGEYLVLGIMMGAASIFLALLVWGLMEYLQSRRNR